MGTAHFITVTNHPCPCPAVGRQRLHSQVPTRDQRSLLPSGVVEGPNPSVSVGSRQHPGIHRPNHDSRRKWQEAPVRPQVPDGSVRLAGPSPRDFLRGEDPSGSPVGQEHPLRIDGLASKNLPNLPNRPMLYNYWHKGRTHHDEPCSSAATGNISRSREAWASGT
jgi:hypothetical protein